jgi:ATP-dependent Zn protease
LLRPGQFDRQVLVDAPDLDGRVAILKVHVRNKPLAAGVDLRRVAQEIDDEVKGILDHAYVEAKEILEQHRDQLELVTSELLKNETLDGQMFHRLIGRKVPEDTRVAAAPTTAILGDPKHN